MKVSRFIRDGEGASLVEFAVTAPLFFLLMFGIIQASLMLWAQVGLQHGTEAAARCASVSDIIYEANLNTNGNPNGIGSFPTPCYSSSGKASANVSSIQSYAAANSFGFNPPASTFSVNPATPPTGTPACTGGNLITASYQFTALTYLYKITLIASSCSPSVAS
jgi:Flp pilus assembly protein TadG